MRNYLKFLATAMVAALLVCAISMSAMAVTTPFKDVDDKKNETLAQAVSLLSNIGVTKGTSDTTFGTMDYVTRQQMAAFVYRLMQGGKSLDNGHNSTRFTDLEDKMYFGYISWAHGTGVIKGTSATTFNPKGGIILQDAYVMLVRALGHEEEGFVYPFSYIDMAETLGLDEGLDSVVGYDTKLTRGDVAVLLYNTFHAEMNKDTTGYREVHTNGSTMIVDTKKDNPTLAEAVYDVTVGSYVVRATPHYAFNNSISDTTYKPLTDDFGKDMLYLVSTDPAITPLDEIYAPFDELGLTGSADDYIMCTLDVFYTYEEKGGVKSLEKVYFGTGKKAVLETNKVGFDRVTVKNKYTDYYYDSNGNLTKTALLQGYLKVGDQKIYLFDAPYSYIKPDYSDALLAPNPEQAKKDARNAKNLKLINVRQLDPSKDTYTYYIESAPRTPEDMHKALSRIFSWYGAAYKMKFYDVDEDGIYEYAHYMPATYGFMDGTTKKKLTTAMTRNAPVLVSKSESELDLKFTPTIYYNGAKLSGKKFEDGDFVVAYVNPAANMIDVVDIIKPYNGYAYNFERVHGQFVMDGKIFQHAWSYAAVEGFTTDDRFTAESTYRDNYLKDYNISSSNVGVFDSSLFKTATGVNGVDYHLGWGEVFDVYAYKIGGRNHTLYYDHIEDSVMSYAMDELIIPVDDDTSSPGNVTTISQFDPKLGESVHYARTYFNGKVSYNPLNIADMYPSVKNTYANGGFNLAGVAGYQNSGKAYLEKISTVDVDKDGLITIKPILHAYNSDGDYIGVNRNYADFASGLKEFYGNDLGYNSNRGYIKKIAGSRYALLDAVSDTSLMGVTSGVGGDRIESFYITGSTRIIIKNITDVSKDEYEFLEFDASSFLGTTSKTGNAGLHNIQYVVQRQNKTSNKINLVLLYAEAEDFEFERKSEKKSWRIVAGSDIMLGEDEEYRYSYRLFNPYTGEVLENVPGDKSAKRPALLANPVPNGTIVEVKEDKVDENGQTLGNVGAIDLTKPDGLVYITEYIASDNMINVVPVQDVATRWSSFCCESGFKNYIDYYRYDGTMRALDGNMFQTPLTSSGVPKLPPLPLYYEITDDTVVTVLTSKNADTALTKGEFKLADISALADAGHEYLCYNDKVIGDATTKDYSTRYSQYIKAYIYTSKSDSVGDLPDAEFILIVVNGDETQLFSDADPAFGNETCVTHS